MSEQSEKGVKIAGNHAVINDGTVWPLPDLRDDGLAWRLTYGVALSSAETARLASIVNAYGYLLTETNRDRRARIVRDIRTAMGMSTPPAPTTDPRAEEARKALGESEES